MRRWWSLREGWWSCFLLLAMILVVAYSLQQAKWPASLQAALAILTPAALLGYAAGFLLTRLRWFPRWLVHPLGFIGGAAWVVYLSGTLQSVHVPGASQPVPYLDPALQGWKDLASELLIRAVFLWRTFLRGASGADAVLFVVVLAFACWMIAFLSAWFAFRSHWPAAAVALPGFVILVNTFYAPQVPPGYFGIFVFLCLTFLIYYLWKDRERVWQRQRVRYARELSWGVIWVGVILSGILVLGTSFLPTTATGEEDGFWNQFFRPWQEVRATWERLFSNVGGNPREGRLGGYAPNFMLSGARTAPPGIAFEVRASRNEYLRGRTFDQYDGHGWTSTTEHGPTWPMSEGDSMHLPRKSRTQAWQIITPLRQGGNMVFAIAEPILIEDLPAVAALSGPFSEVGFADIVAVRSRSALPENESYRVVSLVSTADKTSLRNAGQSYSNWIRDHYLQLPNDLPQRVRNLADQIVAEKMGLATLVQTGTLPMAEIVATTWNQGIQEINLQVQTAQAYGREITIRIAEGRVIDVSPSGALVETGLVSPYDAAEAIQSYLRANLRYDENISAPPLESDAVDYFLFESQVGYCDYFASAMVVLARTQGIPARMVRGYASGTYDQEREAYVVPVSSAHSWVEVLFPEYGWLRFEPTAAEYTTVPQRPEEAPSDVDGGSSSSSTPGNDRDPRDNIPEDEDFVGGPGWPGAGSETAQPFIWSGLILGTLVLAAVVVWTAMYFRIERGLNRLGPVAATYERMCRWAGFLRIAPPGQPTPYETASHLSEAITEQRSNIDLIASHYVRERFSRHRPFPLDIQEVRRAWKNLRWPLWRRPLQRLFPQKSVEPAEEEVE